MYNFDDIEGNDFIKNGMKKAISINKVAHAYIIDGKKGSGKSLLANTFAKALLCDSGDNTPCCECISCRAFDDGNNPDCLYVTPKKTSSLGVDDIREQVNQASAIKPYKYKYKIFIIENADEMSVQAQNALLKTIEEPPSYGIFILTSENYSLFLPTVLSRCVMYKMKPLNIDAVKNFLLKRGCEESMASVAASFSGGYMGKALELIEDEAFGETREDIISILKNLKNLNLSSALLTAKGLEKYKDNPATALDMIYLWYRDAYVYKESQDVRLLIQQDKAGEIASFGGSMPLKLISNGIDAVFEARTALKYNSNFLLTTEVMLMKMTGL